MTENRLVKLFIANILFVLLGSKILEYLIKTEEYKIEKAFIIYFAVSLIYFIYQVNKIKEDKNA